MFIYIHMLVYTIGNVLNTINYNIKNY